jgi:lysozyme family protein
MKWIKKYWYAVVVVCIPITATAIYFLYKFYKVSSINPVVTDVPDTSSDTSMQDIISFIKGHEGGYVNDPDDAGGETNKGVTYATWRKTFGSNAHDRFIAMSDDDWYAIFKPNYWDVISGDSIQSAAVANFLVDWYWGSGDYAIGLKYYGTAYGIQVVLNSLGNALTIDGGIGSLTLAAINAADPTVLLQALHDDRAAFYNAIVANAPNQQKFLSGWLNRLNDLT